MTNLGKQTGIGLVEVMIALGIFALGLLPLWQTQQHLQSLTAQAYQRHTMVQHLSQQLSLMLAADNAGSGATEIVTSNGKLALTWRIELAPNLKTVYLTGAWNDPLGHHQQLSIRSSKARLLTPQASWPDS